MGNKFTSSQSASAQNVLGLGALGREVEAHFLRENYVALRAILKRRQLRSTSTTEQAFIAALQEQVGILVDRRIEILKRLSCGTTIVPLVHGGHGCLRFLSFAKRGTAAKFTQRKLAGDSLRAVNAGCLAVVKLIADELHVPPPMPQSRFMFGIDGCDETDDLSISDRSVALPAAVAFFSAWTGRPIPNGFVLTGDIDPETGELIPASGLDEKLRVLSAELQGWFRVLVVSLNAAPTIRGSSSGRIVALGTLQQIFDHLWGASWRKVDPKTLDLAGALEDATAEYYMGNNHVARLAFDTISTLAGRKTQMRRIKYYALWRKGSCDTHLGNVSNAKVSLEQAARLGRTLSNGIIPPADYYGCLISRAVCLDDAYDFTGAIRAIDDVIRHLGKVNATSETLGRAKGTRALILLHARRFAEAERSYLQSIQAFKAFGKPAELPRSYCWLAIVRGERGDSAGADRAFRTAEKYSELLNPTAFPSQYSLYADARLSVRTGRHLRCVTRTENRLSKLGKSWPVALAIRYRAEALLALNKFEESLDACRKSQDLFCQLDVTETLAPLAAQPRVIGAIAHFQLGDYAGAADQWESAIELIHQHKTASSYFGPLLRPLNSHIAKSYCSERLALLRKMPY